MAASILDLLNVSRELTLEFFSQRLHVLNSHSRRRATLKETTAKSHPTGIPLPEMLHGSTPLSWPPVLNACQYLQQHPPKKQVLQNGALHWVERQGTSGSAIGDMLLSVRTVRNNVFHGGKFPDGVITDPLRDEQLIRDCLAVLKGLLELPLPKDVANIFKRRSDLSSRCHP